MKRRLLALTALAPFVSTCRAVDVADEALKRKFRGIGGVVLWIHAVPDRHFVTVTDELGRQITGPSLLGRGGDNLSYVGPTLPIPKTVRVVWREGAGWDSEKRRWNEGTVAGDFTIPVAERIPDEVLNAARKNRDALRIKIRVVDHGVLLGWDLEHRARLTDVDYAHCDCTPALEWVMPGGDFKQARIFNGKVVERGWVIGPDGRKVEVDY